MEKTKMGKIRHAVRLLEETEDEKKDRKRAFRAPDFEILAEKKLKCTKCLQPFQKLMKYGDELSLHPVLGVLFCKRCCDFYGDGYFSVDSDQEEKYCRWCGEGGTLYECTKCVYHFCRNCIKRNLGKAILAEVEEQDDWFCYICEPKPIWPLRHLAHYAKKELKNNDKGLSKIKDKPSLKDLQELLKNDDSQSIENTLQELKSFGKYLENYSTQLLSSLEHKKSKKDLKNVSKKCNGIIKTILNGKIPKNDESEQSLSEQSDIQLNDAAYSAETEDECQKIDSVPSNASSLSSTPKKLISRRQRTERRDRWLSRRDKKTKTVDDEINALTNLKSLNYKKSKSERKKAVVKKIKKKTESKETLLDMIDQIGSDSGEELLFNTKTELDTFTTSTKALLKNLVLDSSSSELEEDSEEEEKTKKRQKIMSSSSDDEFLATKKRKRSSTECITNSDSDVKNKKKYKRINNASSSSDTEIVKSQSKGRRNLKKIMKSDALQVETKEAVKLEDQRKKRLKERMKKYEELFKDEKKRMILDFDENGDVLLEVDPRLVKRLKPHQRDGVKFMWDNCFESLKTMETSNGGGCILAHCMGLGKTLQAITLLHTVLNNDIGVNTALIVCPLNTVANWVHECEMWFDVAKCDTIDIYNLHKHKHVTERRFLLQSWHKNGGILIIGYDMYRNLTKKMNKVEENALIKPGPDIVVCDEGHLLKNEDSARSRCLSKIQTCRRIVLTGTPMQNNLKEYHCMVQFIKPNILGTKIEFMNRFVNPITNGQYDDSTVFDVETMKKRSHVLHTLLEGCIQRCDYSVLTPFLPPKHEFVLSLAMTEPMTKAYRHYLTNLSCKATISSRASVSLFNDFHALQQIWTHPLAILWHEERAAERKAIMADNAEIEAFVDDREEIEISTGESSNDSVSCLDTVKRSTRANPNTIIVPQEMKRTKQWWEEFIDEKMIEDEKISTKLVILFAILEESQKRNEKMLVFSQSLTALDLIEHFLDLRARNGEHWVPGLNYFRLDGRSSTDKRSQWCKSFNRETNTNAKLFLISTKAGGLGINLVGANRVVIFDASWNPSHDLQSIFRIYRFGQKKTCYVYRLLAEATMEEKIYERQVTKLSLAGRVVDEHQIERHYTMGNLQELYRFEPTPRQNWQAPILPKDDVLAKILKSHADIVVKYHEHDSLLENKEEEVLNEAERRAAWEEYENSQRPQLPQPYNAGFSLAQIIQAQAAARNAAMADYNAMRNQMATPEDIHQYQMSLNANRQHLVNPFAVNPITQILNLNIDTLTDQDLLRVGQTFQLQPDIGETFQHFRQRLGQHVTAIRMAQ